MATESQKTFGPASGVKYRVGVTLAIVRRDVLRDSVCKSMASVDHSDGGLGRALAYFQILLEEVRSESFPPRKPYLGFNLDDCERFQRGIAPTQCQGVTPQILHRPARTRKAEGLDSEQHFSHRSLVRNVSLFTLALLRELHQLVVQEGVSLLGVKKEPPLRVRVDSFVVETKVHYPTDVSLLWDAVRYPVFDIVVRNSLILRGRKLALLARQHLYLRQTSGIDILTWARSGMVSIQLPALQWIVGSTPSGARTASTALSSGSSVSGNQCPCYCFSAAQEEFPSTATAPPGPVASRSSAVRCRVPRCVRAEVAMVS